MEKIKNLIPNNILASLSFVFAYLLLNVNTNWGLVLPFILLVYIYVTKREKIVKGSILISIAILLFSFFMGDFFNFLNACGAKITNDTYTITNVVIGISLITLSVLSFFLIGKNKKVEE